MYVFATQWPPALKATVSRGDVPFGKVFSCFMAASMLGSSAFGRLARRLPAERVLAGALALAAGSMSAALTAGRRSPAALLGCFLAFEAAVGMYFPAMGTLRSEHLPDSHRNIMMSMFEVPMNLLVVGTMLGAKRLGVRGSLACSAVALQIAFLVQARFCFAGRRQPKALAAATEAQK
mmetsp:Transcript_44402/g.138248  ORF Transcript_44402/g.138248 Transcript_44402/m.138248 type:complete len:178 (+) Transcript_44402:18-551(+)